MSEPQRYEIAGKVLQCPHCGRDEFVYKRVFCESRLPSFWGLRAAVYVCTHCGHIVQFSEDHGDLNARFVLTSNAAKSEGQTDEVVSSEPIKCLACGETIPEFSETCSVCGWSWK